MARITYENNKVKTREQKRVKELWAKIVTEANRNTWIRVYSYKNRYYAGTYRNRHFHGFTKKEWEFLRDNPHIQHVIKLKLGENLTDYQVGFLIAHEFAHLLQYHNGKKPKVKQKEVHADNWAKYKLEQLNIRETKSNC